MMFLISQKLRKTRDEKSWEEEIYYTSMTNNMKNVTLNITEVSYYTGHTSAKQVPIHYMPSILSQLNKVSALQCSLLVYKYPHIF